MITATELKNIAKVFAYCDNVANLLCTEAEVLWDMGPNIKVEATAVLDRTAGSLKIMMPELILRI